MSKIEILQIRGQVHVDQANRLMAHPLVAEYAHHLRELNAIQQEIAKHAAETPACEPDTDSPISSGPECLPAGEDRVRGVKPKVHTPSELDS